jgi:hypothetical protein
MWPLLLICTSYLAIWPYLQQLNADDPSAEPPTKEESPTENEELNWNPPGNRYKKIQRTE